MESDGGRVLEVTRDGEIVWEFVNPERRELETEPRPMIPVIGWAERIDPSGLDPDLLEMQSAHSQG